MAELIWFNIWDGHFKMWGFDMYSNEKTGESNVIIYYGRITDSLQKLRKLNKKFKTYFDCYDYIMAKIKDKDSKGYIQLQNSDWGKFTTGEISLSELIAMIESVKAKGGAS